METIHKIFLDCSGGVGPLTCMKINNAFDDDDDERDDDDADANDNNTIIMLIK